MSISISNSRTMSYGCPLLHGRLGNVFTWTDCHQVSGNQDEVERDWWVGSWQSQCTGQWHPDPKYCYSEDRSWEWPWFLPAQAWLLISYIPRQTPASSNNIPFDFYYLVAVSGTCHQNNNTITFLSVYYALRHRSSHIRTFAHLIITAT